MKVQVRSAFDHGRNVDVLLFSPPEVLPTQPLEPRSRVEGLGLHNKCSGPT